MTEITISTVHLGSLAKKLDAMDLTDDERTTLNAVLAAAGTAVAQSRDDVSGFGILLDEYRADNVSLNFGKSALESFSWGAASPQATVGIVLQGG